MTARIGLISDTHGLLRVEALDALRGADLIIHAGDIGGLEILQRLGAIAPVTAVRGNNDTGDWARHLRVTASVAVGDVHFFAIHDLAQLSVHPPPSATRVIVSGHSHRASVSERAGILYVNPGGAGPRRFRLPVTIAEVTVHGAAASARCIELAIE